MDRQILEVLTPVIIVMVGIFAVTAFVFLRSPVSTAVKFMMVPVAFISAAIVPLLFAPMLGFAVPTSLPNQFFILGHNLVVTKEKKVLIEVWAKTKNNTRLYVIPHSKTMEDMMKKAEEGREAGMEGRMTKKSGNGILGSESIGEGPGYTLDLLKPEDMLPPKEPAPPPRVPLGPKPELGPSV